MAAGRATETQVEPPEVAARRAAAEEEAKRAAIRAMGTMVTPENFLQWKAKFDAEMAAVGAGQCGARATHACKQSKGWHGGAGSAQHWAMLWHARWGVRALPAQAKAKALEGAADNEKSKRMTGKQWFMQERIQEAKDEQDNEVRVWRPWRLPCPSACPRAAQPARCERPSYARLALPCALTGGSVIR